MGAPKGNKNAVGKNVGRKSAYQEHQDARELHDLWEKEHDIESLINKIKGKKFNARTRFVLRILQGKDSALIELFRKIFPDKLNVRGNLDISKVLDEIE